MEVFSKPIKDVLECNKYIETNEAMRKQQVTKDDLYKKQTKRTVCKMCFTPLNTSSASFERGGIKYYVCENCGHLNGEFEENEKFMEDLYSTKSEEKEEYSEKFIKENSSKYFKRVENIYVPKAKFLINALEENNENPATLSFADYGGGAGHFVNALKSIGMKNIKGYEVSENQVNYANKVSNDNLMEVFDINQSEKFILNLKCDVFSMIGVLEHVLEPVKILEAIKNNKSIKYFYFSLPLFSLASLFQGLFDNVYERQLAGAHTHLFTKESIDYFVKKNNFKIIGEWWFGTDIADLYRGMILKGINEKVVNKYLLEPLDELQNILDKRKICSEVHMLLKVN